MPSVKFDDTEPGKHLQAARDMLAFHGIDPNNVLRDGVYAEGYDYIVRNENGDPIIRNYELAVEFVAWPKSFPVASFFEHYWAWKRAVV